MKEVCDYKGKVFGKLTVIEINEEVTKSKMGRYWICKCECGNYATFSASELKARKSCGCMRPRKSMGINRPSSSRLYAVWLNMRRRCYNPNSHDYHNYGGRGIGICDDWQIFSEFEAWAKSTDYDENADFMKCTLDRIDHEKDYAPDNCRWVPISVQQNNKRTTIMIEMDGVTKSLADWCSELGIDAKIVRSRINRGWDKIDALRRPIIKRK